MRDDGPVRGPGGEIHRGEGLGQGADLVHLDQHGVGHIGLDPPLDQLDIGHEDVVTDELHPIAEGRCVRDPSVPVVFGHPSSIDTIG